MRIWNELLRRIDGMCGFAKTALWMGALMMLCFMIVGITAYIIAPHVPNYIGAMGVFRGSLEAAPASLCAGVCVAVICDLASPKKRDQEKDGEK